MSAENPKILLVDDDRDLLQLVGMRLTAAGYGVTAVESYIEKLRALARDVARESRSRPPQLSLLQRIDRIVDSARNLLTALEDIAQSAKALYAGLSPDQQKMAGPRLANLIAMPLAAR
jgi:CheY-like chemotaxis protein